MKSVDVSYSVFVLIIGLVPRASDFSWGQSILPKPDILMILFLAALNDHYRCWGLRVCGCPSCTWARSIRCGRCTGISWWAAGSWCWAIEWGWPSHDWDHCCLRISDNTWSNLLDIPTLHLCYFDSYIVGGPLSINWITKLIQQLKWVCWRIDGKSFDGYSSN